MEIQLCACVVFEGMVVGEKMLSLLIFGSIVEFEIYLPKALNKSGKSAQACPCLKSAKQHCLSQVEASGCLCDSTGKRWHNLLYFQEDRKGE